MDVVDLSGLAFVANTSVYHSEGYVTNNCECLLQEKVLQY